MKIARFSALISLVLTLLLFMPASSFAYDILESFSGFGPGGLVFDEATNTLWYSDMNNQMIRNLNSDDGSQISFLDVSTYNDQPKGLSFRNGSLWSTDQFNSNIYELNSSNGNILNTFNGVGGLTFDNNGDLWRGPSPWDNVMFALNPSNGSQVGTMNLGIQGNESFIMGLAFDSDTQTFWVSNNFNNNLMNVDMNGQTLSTVNFSPGSAPAGYNISGLAFDDVSNTLWVNYADFMSGPSNGIIYEVSMGSVAPEPVSSVLFVIGGTTLGLRRWKYFKKTG